MERIITTQFENSPNEIVVLYSRIQPSPPELMEEEVTLLLDASPYRCLQVRTCRYLCRLGIASLGGHSNSAIPSQDNGAPIFPTGFCGSISHIKSHCVVVVARNNSVSRIGIDIEEKSKYFEQNEWHLISTELEQNDVHQCPQLSMDEYINLLFSTKEAIYKCISGVLVDELEFNDIVCRKHRDKSALDVTVLRAMDPSYSQGTITTSWCVFGDLIVSMAWMR